MESWKNRSPVRDELGTAEPALGRVGRAGVCEHDEGVACRRVDLVASYREKGKKLRLRNAEELSQASTNNIVHVFINTSYSSIPSIYFFYVERECDTVARTDVKFRLDGELYNLHSHSSRRPGLLIYTSKHLHVLP